MNLDQVTQIICAGPRSFAPISDTWTLGFLLVVHSDGLPWSFNFQGSLEQWKDWMLQTISGACPL